MEGKRWLHQQNPRRFFILWAINAAWLSGIQITGGLIGAAWHRDHMFHAPPLWLFPLEVLGAAILAAVQSRSHAGRVAN